ncbi:MAG TPA: hypothetical protein VFG08_03615 [Candidatus Polarisedimenticolia bacterium]|nr:hypothetical protein [Candidatus Polarisedimenticolia bacterium]
MNRLLPSLLCLVIAVSAPLWAAETSDSNLQILLDKVHADKKLLVAANMELNDAQGKAFWPVYDDYQKELQVINKRLIAVIGSYADAWNTDTVTDDKAKSLLDEALAIEEAQVALRKKYVDKLTGVLPAMLVARFVQIENKIRAAVNFELAEEIPLVE